MTTLAISKTKKSAKAPLSPALLDFQSDIVATDASLMSAAANLDVKLPKIPYTPADLRPGKLVLVEFSRPGGAVKSDEDEANPSSELGDLTEGEKRKTRDSLKLIEKMTLKVVNMGYAKMVTKYVHNPFGFYCRQDEVMAVYKTIEEVQKCAYFVNNLAQEMKSNRRVRIDVYPMTWDHKDQMIRERMGEMIAEKLIELRDAYTCKVMHVYRIRFNKAKNIERMLMPGEQADLVRKALAATKAQRRTMIAIYGDKCPTEWLDPQTGRLKEDIRLSFTDIDRAIKHFCPSWRPAENLPF